MTRLVSQLTCSWAARTGVGMCDFVGTPLKGLELQPMVDYINGLHAGGRRAAPAAPRGHRQRRAEGPEDRSGRISRVAPAGRSGQRSNFRNFRNRPSASGGGAEVNSAWIIQTRAVSAVWRTRRERSCRPGSRQAARGVGSPHSRGRDPHAATAQPKARTGPAWTDVRSQSVAGCAPHHQRASPCRLRLGETQRQYSYRNSISHEHL